MPYSIPQRITDFFTDYPLRLPVYVNEDDVSYLNHYREKAIKDAKQAKKRLYKVTKEGLVLSPSLVWPETLKSELVFDASSLGFYSVSIDDNVNIVSGGQMDPSNVISAFNAAVLSAGFEGEMLIEVEGTDWTITTIINGDPTIIMVDEDDNPFTLTLKPLV